MIKQFLPQEYCLSCRLCCRFKEENSVWSPCLLDEEIQALLDKKIPAASISIDRRLHPVHSCSEGTFICPFLDAQENKCKIYAFRPFECQLYPFLISLRGKRILLTLDLNCPYARAKLNSPELKEYTAELTAFLNKPSQIKILKDNPQIIQAYEEVLDVIELKISDETK